MRRTIPRKEKNDFLQKNSFIIVDERSPLQFDEKEGLYYSSNEKIALQIDNIIIPYLKYKNNDLSKLPSVIIDMPAVPFMTNGADLLRPGIVKLDEFNEGDLIIIRDEKNNIPLAIMRALFSSKDIMGMDKGKVAKSLHYVNDKYWKNN